MAARDAIVVGGGIMGVSAAYWLSLQGVSVTLLDQAEVPNRSAASGDYLRALSLSWGKDSFYTDLLAKSLTLWLELNQQLGEKVLMQNGVLDLASELHGFEEDSLKVLREMRLGAERLEKGEIKRRYPMINTKAVKWALYHPAGGMIWANRATQALAGLAQRKGAKIRTFVKAAEVLRDARGVRAIRDSSGRLWKAETFIFAAGCWTPELLRNFRLPIELIKQEQFYFRPPLNSGRYRPEHFPVFSARKEGIWGFPLHIRGFLKLADHRENRAGKKSAAAAKASPAFERKCRRFLERFVPDLSRFGESEGVVCYSERSKDGDFIVDRIPGAPNALVACGFALRGFAFGPLIGKILAGLALDAKPEINLQRLRLARFKRGS